MNPDLRSVSSDLVAVADPNLGKFPARGDQDPPEQPQTKLAPFPIQPSEILVVTKLSKVEHDMRRLDLSYDALIAEYAKGGEDIARIVESHNRQVQARQILERYFPPEQILSRDELCPEHIAQAKAVFAFGGDNHFQFVAQQVFGEKPVLGINSDPNSSFGALLNGKIEDLQNIILKLSKADYQLEPWTRLAVKVDGQELNPALGDVFLGEKERKYMSRHLLIGIDGQSVEQKSSGLLISTGSGSSGWFKSAGRYLYPEGHEFSRSEVYAEYILSEPSATVVSKDNELRQDLTLPPRSFGVLYPGQLLKVISLNDSAGIVSVDSLQEVAFNRGSVAEVVLAKEPLWAIAL